ncbi:hypothetical protein SVIOM74S_03437 [Streptomyces violarus]
MAGEGRSLVAVDDEVVGDGRVEGGAVVQPVLRYVADAGPAVSCHVETGRVGAVDVDRARRRAAQSGEDLGEFALAVALDAGHADDLPGGYVEVETVQGLAGRSLVAEAPYPQGGVRGTGRGAVHVQGHVPADHHRGEGALGGVGGGDRADQGTGAHHAHLVADLPYLAQLVRDEQHGHPAVAQPAHGGEQVLALLRGEHGGRLVEDQYACLPVERLEDLGALTHPDRHLVDARLGVDGESGLLREPGGRLHGRLRVDQPATARLHTEDDVLGDGEGRHQHEVLVHHAHTQGDRRGRAAQYAWPSADQDLARAGLFQAVEHLHQRGLARAVLADDRPDLARRDLQVHGAHRAHPVGVGLGDLAGGDGRTVLAPWLVHRQGRSVRGRWAP